MRLSREIFSKRDSQDKNIRKIFQRSSSQIKPLKNLKIIQQLTKKKDQPSNEAPNFSYFTEHSSIHGIRFLSKRQNNNFTRIFWTVSLILSIIGLYYNGKRLYVKLNVAPDISITIKQKLAREIPFPAITLCLPMFTKPGLANFTHYTHEYYKNPQGTLSNLTESEKKYLAVNSLKCGVERAKVVNHCCNQINIQDLGILKLMEESTPLVDDVMGFCNLEATQMNCNDMFSTIFTENGLCYTTNMQSLNTIYETNVLSSDLQAVINKSSRNHDAKVNWTLDEEYINNSEVDVIPMRLSKANDHIFVVYSSQEDAFNFCRQNSVFIYIHLPNEVPTMFHRHIRLQYGHTKRIQIHTRVTAAHPSLKSYSPAARGCFFEGEKKLHFFKVYTKFHCYIECLSQYVLGKCGCVGFHMPRDSTTSICGLQERACLDQNANNWPDINDLVDGTTPCGCYPTCNHIEYYVDEDDYAYNPQINADKFKNFSRSNIYSRIIVQFNEHAIQQNEKYVSYKLQNFIADIGGLLGLFLGCSLLSMVEILYFICMGLKDKYYRRRLNNSKIFNNEGSANNRLMKSLDQIGDDIYIVRSPLYKRRKF